MTGYNFTDKDSCIVNIKAIINDKLITVKGTINRPIYKNTEEKDINDIRWKIIFDIKGFPQIHLIVTTKLCEELIKTTKLNDKLVVLDLLNVSSTKTKDSQCYLCDSFQLINLSTKNDDIVKDNYFSDFFFYKKELYRTQYTFTKCKG